METDPESPRASRAKPVMSSRDIIGRRSNIYFVGNVDLRSLQVLRHNNEKQKQRHK